VLAQNTCLIFKFNFSLKALLYLKCREGRKNCDPYREIEKNIQREVEKQQRPTAPTKLAPTAMESPQSESSHVRLQARTWSGRRDRSQSERSRFASKKITQKITPYKLLVNEKSGRCKNFPKAFHNVV